MTVNLTQNHQEIKDAWLSIANDSESERWALFGYEDNTNVIKLLSQGSSGISQLVQEFHCSSIQYATCRVINKSQGVNKLILLNWQGESAALNRKGLCASHITDVASIFKGCSLILTLRNEDDANPDHIMEQVLKNSSKINLPSRANSGLLQNDKFDSHNETTNSLPSRINISEDLASTRKAFWENQEREEKERLEEEKRKAVEKQAQFDKERKLRDEAERLKLAEKVKDRDKKIDATLHAEKKQFKSYTQSKPNNIPDDNDDDRVGRRSEILRLERDQETTSLITKGSLRNKRALFEKESNQKNGSPEKSSFIKSSSNLKTSNSMVSQRLEEFHKMSSSSSMDKVSSGDLSKASSTEAKNGIASNPINTEPIQRQFETIKIINDEENHRECTVKQVPDLTDHTANSNNEVKAEKFVNGRDLNGNDSIIDTNGHNTKLDSPSKTTEPIIISDIQLENDESNGKCAKALFDYQASDDTEISFDPEDIIGHIEKVDQGWWHGKVMTGHFTGQMGLFPSNYVEEL